MLANVRVQFMCIQVIIKMALLNSILSLDDENGFTVNSLPAICIGL